MIRMITLLVATLLVSDAFAQVPAPSPSPTPAPSPAVVVPPNRQAPPSPQPTRRDPGVPAQLVNVRIDVTLAEEGGTDAPTRKTVSLTLADRQSGSVRSMETQDKGRANLDIDVFPMVHRDGRVQAQVTISYSMPNLTRFSSMRVEPLLTSGKPLMVSTAVSPTSDRRVSVEVTATVLK